MSSLYDSLPAPGDREGLKALFRKRRAEYDEGEKRKKSRASSEVVRQIPSAAPKPDDTMDVEPEFDFRAIVNPLRNPKCAFKYQDAHGNSTAVIGDALASTKGFSINLEADGGRFGCPMLCLNVRINKRAKDVPVSIKSDEYFEYKVTWRSDIAIEGQSAIHSMRFSPVMSLAQSGDHQYDQAMVDDCPQEHNHKLQKVVVVVFDCSYTQISPAEAEWLNGLSDKVKEGLFELFFGVGLHRMTIYFVPWPDASTAYNDWCKHLETAVNTELSALWQYLSADGTTNFSITEGGPTALFKKGMYAKYARRRTKDGRVEEDRSAIVGYHRFGKKVIWEVNYEFGLYNTIPVIRNTHFEQGQVAHLSIGTQLVHLQRMPAVTTRNKDTGATTKHTPDDLESSFRG